MRIHSKILRLLAGVFVLCLIGAGEPAADCPQCAAPVCCTKKVCKLVCEDKNVEVVCWGCKCEDFCVPGPGCPTCEHCKLVCPNCDEATAKAKVCAEPKRFTWFDWCTCCCPQMYTRTKLMKRVEVVKVPTYKWVVEEVPVCDCGDACDCADGAANDAAPIPKTTDEAKAK